MDPEKNDKPETEEKAQENDEAKQDTPADALSKTPDELEEEQAAKAVEEDEKNADAEPEEKKVSPLKRFLRRVNVYLLLFILATVVGGVISIVSYLNSQQEPPEPNIAAQELTDEELKQLASKDVAVGDTSQTLTINGNAVIAGQTLMRGDLNVAGNLHTGGGIQGPTLTIAGDTNLGSTQISSLEVAQTAAIEGETTVGGGLKVSGTTSFSGPITASQITVTQLVMSGNGILRIPNHIQFTGPSPSRSIVSSTLGSGGTASVNGSDTSGTININTGNNPQAGCFVEVTFKQPFSKQPRVIVTPIGSAAGNLSFYVTRNPVSFSICANNAASANKSFAFDYFVAG